MPTVKKLEKHKLLLDTHIWIWLMQGNDNLSLDFRKAIDRCQAFEGILISSISIWEIGMLVNKKKLILGMETLDWVNQTLELPGVILVPISPRIAIQSTTLPGEVHGDPTDRILIATAHEESAVLTTCDKKILDYGNDSFVSVYNPLEG